MVELLHIHFSFLCRKWRNNKKGQSPIILRIIYREERRDLYTGLYCNANDWDTKNCRAKNSAQSETINKNLELIHYRAVQVFDGLKFSRTPFTIDELVSEIKGKEDRPTMVVEYLNSRIEEFKKKKGLDITEATYDKYERCGRFAIDFLETEFKVKNYSLVKIDNKFLETYFQYLRVVRNICNNTAVKYMAFLKTLLMPAIQNGTRMLSKQQR